MIMQPESQQSFVFVFLKVPQIQFMIRVPDIPVACRDGPSCAEHHWYFTGAGMVVWVSTQAFPFFTRVATVVTQAVDDGCRTR